MRKTNLLIGLVFLVVSAAIILLSDISPMLFPTQDIGLRTVPELGPVYSGNLFIQELTAKKDYIYGLKIVLGNWEPINQNENLLLVCDNSYQIRYMKKFKSKEIQVPNFYPFNFNKKIRVGKGNKFYVCVYSVDGSQNNNIALGRLITGNLGKLYVARIQGDDVIASLKKKDLFFEGSLCIKTFESDTAGMSAIKVFLLLFSALISLFIIYFEKVRRFLGKIRFVPENIYLFFSISAGLLFVFITPPLQVPDEQRHFDRAYQLTELNIYVYDETFPNALKSLADYSSRMNFRPLEKTTHEEIMEQSKVRIDPQDRAQLKTVGIVIPMIPQALGIAMGRLFNSSPLWLLYWGRLLNLITAVLLTYIAIRKTPVQKWVFFLLGLMPMTLFQLASVSYDAVTMSLTFFVISFYLNLALNKQKIIRTADLIVLFIACFLLAMCKLPYFIAGFLFVLIPINKIGTWKKYIFILSGLTVTMFIGTQLYSFTRPWFEPAPNKTVPLTVVKPEVSSANPVDSIAAKTEERVTSFNAEAQKQFILNNVSKYIGIVAITIKKATGIWLQSFVGVLGWVDTFLPPALTWSYLVVLLLAAIGIRQPGISIGILPRLVLVILFSAGILIILTGLYLYANDTGNQLIQAVQGRYFIPFAPLFFLIFYNNWKFQNDSRKSENMHEKNSKLRLKNNKQSLKNIKPKSFPLENILVTLIIMFTVISLGTTFYILIDRYYNI